MTTNENKILIQHQLTKEFEKRIGEAVAWAMDPDNNIGEANILGVLQMYTGRVMTFIGHLSWDKIKKDEAEEQKKEEGQ